MYYVCDFDRDRLGKLFILGISSLGCLHRASEETAIRWIENLRVIHVTGTMSFLYIVFWIYTQGSASAFVGETCVPYKQLLDLQKYRKYVRI